MFWFLVIPFITRFKGYLPGKAIGLEDMPAGVYWQWRKWCTSRNFFEVDIGGTLPSMNPNPYKGPVKIIGFTDDDTAPKVSLDRLEGLYKQAQVTRRMIDPVNMA